MRAEQFFFGNPFESEFDLPPGFMGGVAVQEQEEEQEEGVTPPLASNPLYTGGQLGSITDAYKDVLASGATTDDPDEVSAYYDLGLRESEKTSGLDPFADTFGSEAAGMGGVSAAAGAGMNIPATALSNVVSAEDYAAATTDYTPELSQDQGDFTGKLNRFTATAQEDLGGFQNEIRTLLLDKVPQIQATTGANYEQALYTAYTQDPEVQQLMGQYGVNPLFSDSTGQYLYDPFSFGELRTYEINESDFATGVRTLAEIGKAVMLSKITAGTAEALGNIFADVGLFGEEALDVKIDAAGNITTATDTSGVTTVGDVLDVIKGGATPATAEGAISGIAGPLNMLSSIATAGKYYDPDDPKLQEERIETAAEKVRNKTSDRQEAEGILSDAELDPVTIKQILDTAYGTVRTVALPEETTDTTEKAVRPDEPEEVIAPPETPLDVITEDITLDDALEAIEVEDFEEDIAPPTFTQEQVDAQIAEAVSGATQGLLTQEQADAATQAAIDALPEDTTEFNQADIDSAVSSAVQEVESAFAEERTGFESTIESLESLGQEAETQRQEEIAGYQTSITELENALTNLENRKELAIRSGDERLAETIADYEQQIKDRLAEAEQTFSEERGTLESQLEEEQQEITELESTVTALRGALETSKTTASDLRTTLESTQTALQEQQEITQAKESDIEGLTTSVNTLTGTVSDLSTKITEVTAAKDKAIADGDQKLADAMANAEATLEATKAEAEETLQNAIAAGETKAADAVAAGQAAVADAVAAGEAAVASAVAQGQAEVAEAVAAGEAAATAAEAAGREEGFGEGLGQGRGEGVGAGTGLGLALGLGAGMLQPQSVTKTMFEDFEFEKKYEAPEILAGLTGLPVYQAPKIGLFQGLI